MSFPCCFDISHIKRTIISPCNIFQSVAITHIGYLSKIVDGEAKIIVRESNCLKKLLQFADILLIKIKQKESKTIPILKYLPDIPLINISSGLTPVVQQCFHSNPSLYVLPYLCSIAFFSFVELVDSVYGKKTKSAPRSLNHA